MKVRIIDTTIIQLESENDAEDAILRDWENSYIEAGNIQGDESDEHAGVFLHRQDD